MLLNLKQQIFSNYKLTNWELLELFGFFDIDAVNINTNLPIEIFLKGYDKQYDQKIEFLNNIGINTFVVCF